MLGGVYVMVAVAFTLIIGMLNFLNFTIPALFMFSAVMMWATIDRPILHILTRSHHQPRFYRLSVQQLLTPHRLNSRSFP
ncbi:hypothetical protein OAJ57_00605 [Alphaproteobacteria bacterium]|nr:hypothetical protein [Alphaproteobacteria bacterium]